MYAQKITDALSKLPADTPQQYNQVMAELMSTGEEGLLDLIGRLNPPGDKSNAALDFAISGWIHCAANDAAARGVAASALEKALGREPDKEIKAFLIRQLRMIADDDNVDALSTFLKDEYLSAPAAQALVSIGTEKAGNALLTALTTSNAESIRLNLIGAIGQTGYEQAEPALLALLNENPQETMRKALLDALGNVGTKKSLKALDAPDIALLGRLNGAEPKLVKKEAEKLLAQGKHDLMIAATELLLAQPSAKQENILKAAIETEDIIYLTGTLNLCPVLQEKSLALLQKELASNKSPNVQTALIYWAGNNDIKTALPLVARLAGSPDGMVRKAAIRSLAKLGGEEALTTLTALLKSDDGETVTLAKNALSSYNGDISNALASTFEDCGDAGKTAILELISNRKMVSLYSLVYGQLFVDAVKPAAADALKNVVTDKNLPDLFTLLEQADEAQVAPVQQAINAALNCLPANEQTPPVAERMKTSSRKHLYYTALANSGSQEALDFITNAYASAEGAEKAAAFNALAQWNSFRVVSPLLDIARNSNDSSELEKVTGALISAIRNSEQAGDVRFPYLREAMLFAQTDRQKNDILRLTGGTGQYQAMLFAAEYMDVPALKEAAAVAAMNIAINNPSFAGAETTRILNKVSQTLSNPDADYQRQAIAKYLAENPG
jgi:HEAT repeat protein